MSLSPLAAASWVHRHQRNGKPYGSWFGFYRFPDEGPDALRRVNLQTKDRRSAERKLRQLIEDEHAVREGLRPAPEKVAATSRPLTEYLKAFEADLAACELSRDYRRKFKQRLPKLFAACGWTRPVDISGASFEDWRAGSDLGPKTKNDYLDAARRFAAWLVDRGALESNPLANVRKAKKKQTRPRRPLTLDEARALIAATPCPRRAMLYELAVSSGGRLNELLTLRWADLDLEAGAVTFRGEHAKNGRTQLVPLPVGTVASLRAFRPVDALASDRIFDRGIGRHTFDEDLARAGIAKHDAENRAATFHGLRMTFNQLLQESGTPLRHAQHLMRHSDPRLTANNYLDPERLPVRESMSRFPALRSGDTVIDTADTAKDTVETVAERRSVSSTDADRTRPDETETSEKTAGCHRLTSSDVKRRQPAEKWSRGDSNPRAGTVSTSRLRV